MSECRLEDAQHRNECQFLLREHVDALCELISELIDLVMRQQRLVRSFKNSLVVQPASNQPVSDLFPEIRSVADVHNSISNQDGGPIVRGGFQSIKKGTLERQTQSQALH